MTGLPPLREPAAAEPEVLFSEGGASWLWVLSGPVVGVIMVLLQLGRGTAVGFVVPVALSTLLFVFVAIPVKAARIHTSVELTADTLREGTETVDVDEIAWIYPPEPPARLRGGSPGWLAYGNSALTTHALRLGETGQADPDGERDAADGDARDGEWQTSRALGELTGVPRGRTAIGLRLADGRDVQAWAHRHRELREALTRIVEQRRRGRDR
jgi:hypothetical protein